MEIIIAIMITLILLLLVSLVNVRTHLHEHKGIITRLEIDLDNITCRNKETITQEDIDLYRNLTSEEPWTKTDNDRDNDDRSQKERVLDGPASK